MRNLLAVLVLGVVVLAIGAELLAPRYVEARIVAKVREHTAGLAGVQADAGGFPFLLPLLLDGEVRRVTVTLEEVAGQQVPISSITLGMEGIRLRRDRLLRGEVEVLAIDAGVATAELTLADLEEVLGPVAELAPGLVDIRDRILRLTPAAGSVTDIRLPTDLLPCTPEMDLLGDVLRLSCVFDDVPAVLLRAVSTR